jgi:hypothetical protein
MIVEEWIKSSFFPSKSACNCGVSLYSSSMIGPNFESETIIFCGSSDTGEECCGGSTNLYYDDK